MSSVFLLLVHAKLRGDGPLEYFPASFLLFSNHTDLTRQCRFIPLQNRR